MGRASSLSISLPFRGVITEVADHGVLVSLSTSVRGLVPVTNLSEDEGVTKKFREHFKRGMGARVVVRKVDEERRGLILSVVGESSVCCVSLILPHFIVVRPRAWEISP